MHPYASLAGESSGSHSGKYEYVLWDLRRAVRWNYLRHQGATLIMEAVSTSETSGNFYQTTRCKIPEDSSLYSEKIEHIVTDELQVCRVRNEARISRS
jgi:hypothetical protein